MEKYVYSPDGIMCRITKSGEVISYARDGLGNVIATVDANGNIIESFRYDAYGNRIGDSANSTEKFGYRGEFIDTETGLIYLRNRYYKDKGTVLLSCNMYITSFSLFRLEFPKGTSTFGAFW